MIDGSSSFRLRLEMSLRVPAVTMLVEFRVEVIEGRLVTAIPLAAVVAFLDADLLLPRLQLMTVGG